MSTKTDSYERVLTGGYVPSRQEQILGVLKTFKALTRAEIAKETGIATCSATARVKELLDLGKIKVMGTVWDAKTCRTVELLSINSEWEKELVAPIAI